MIREADDHRKGMRKRFNAGRRAFDALAQEFEGLRSRIALSQDDEPTLQQKLDDCHARLKAAVSNLRRSCNEDEMGMQQRLAAIRAYQTAHGFE